MHVPLICLSVIMILRFDLCSSGENKIEDLSDRCSKGRLMYFYLTSGAGFSDELVKMIATERKTDCVLKFSVRKGNYVMVVLEFPDMKRHERVCYTEEKTSVTVRDYSEKEVCETEEVAKPFYRLLKDEMSVRFQSDGGIGTAKITATSMRDGSHEKCYKNSETECVVENKIYCMTLQALCDGHNNCGTVGLNDEDDIKCKGPKLPFLVIFCSLIMALITLLMLMSIAIGLVPRRKEPYVHNFDQAMSLFDCENGVVTVEIDIVVVFPEDQDTSDKDKYRIM